MDDHIRNEKNLRKPEDDDLTPLSPLDPDRIENCADLLEAMSMTAFNGRRLGEALDVLHEMVTDPKCMVIGTFSGAMTVAKMGGLLVKMVDEGWVDVIVSTGALMCHGLVESIGLAHYKYDPERMNDSQLFAAGYNRVYDTLEPETNLTHAEKVMSEVLGKFDNTAPSGSEAICRAIGKHLHETEDAPGILKSAYEKDVPVYIPAFTDSELALDVACYYLRQNQDPLMGDTTSQLPFNFNPFLDLTSYTRKVIDAERIGIFTIGGGVPRNWAQQVGPFLEIMSFRNPGQTFEPKRFRYALRVCPEPPHWGGLSGCTYSEGVSWGKFVPPSEGGRFAEVMCDATIAWPLLVRGLMDRLGTKK